MSKQEQDKLIINNLSIDIYPRIAKYLNALRVCQVCVLSLIFNLVSCEKAHHLRRKVVLRDKKEQKEVEEKELKDAAKQVPELLSEIESLRQVIEEKDREIERNDADRMILGSLYEKGIIDGEGNLPQ